MRKLIDAHPYASACAVALAGLLSLLGVLGVDLGWWTQPPPALEQPAPPPVIEAPDAGPVLLGAVIVLRWQVAPGIVTTSRLIVDPKSIAEGQSLEALRCVDALQLPR